MAGFNAATAAEPLDFTFEPFASGCSGTIAEPSDLAVAVFFAEVRQITAEARKHAAATAKALDSGAEDPAGETGDAGTVTGMYRRQAETYAALCGGRPSADDILRLPLRIRANFFAWLQAEVVRPSAAR